VEKGRSGLKGSESSENMVSVELVKKLQLATKSHPKPYKLTWINIDTEIIVNNDTTKRLMPSAKCRSVEVINNPARPRSNHREVNCINYKEQ
jgi:hypothetical protein